MLNAKEIEKNYNEFRDRINVLFPTRSNNLNKMYDYFEERIMVLPASAYEHYHNAFTGGYIDHVLRVVDFAEKEHNNWKECGLLTDNYTLEELLFAAYHHDLGKVGMKGEYNSYMPNPSKWHRENQGKIYEYDIKQPFMLVPDMSLFTLQQFNVPISWSEYMAIRTHDGVYDRANEAYYFSSQLHTRPRTNINQILHNADFKAARFEFERWVRLNPNKFKFYTEQNTTISENTPSNNNDVDLDDLFKEFEI